jgi:hypothetical protein
VIADSRAGAGKQQPGSKSMMSLIRIRLTSIALLSFLVACGSPTPNLPRVAALSRPDTLAAQAVPATLEQVLDALDRGLSGSDFQAMQVLGEDVAVSSLYRARPRPWRGPWNLSTDGPLQHEFSRAGFRHPDDMWEAALRSFWRRLHGRPIDLAGLAREANAVRDAARVAPHWVVFTEQAAESLVRNRCDRAMPSPDSPWVPDAAMIRQLEEALPAALQAALDHAMPSGSARFKVSDYYRQYGGLVVGGEKIIYVNGFHRELLDSLPDFPTHAMFWRTSPVEGCDGGLFLFGAEYDPSTRHVRSIRFNSPG